MFRPNSIRVLHRATATSFRPTVAPSRLRFLSSSHIRFAAKDTQDKDTLKPTSNEYSKSGSDAETAKSDAAFNPDKTSPEAAEATAEQEAGGKDNSLSVSPSNPEVSKPNDPEVGGSSNAPSKKPSGGGSAPKAGGGGSG